MRARWTALAVLGMVVLASAAYGATGGAELDSLYSVVVEWLSGTPARIGVMLALVGGLVAFATGRMGIGLVMVFTGLSAGVVRYIVDARFSALF